MKNTEAGIVTLVRRELLHHVPFTAFGAFIGIVITLVFLKGLSHDAAHEWFYVLHPLHVLLSALATASMYEVHIRRKTGRKSNLLKLVLVGYVGSIGIATLSDSIIPFLGETLLNMPDRAIHLGFIEKWWLVNPLALLGIAIAYFKPSISFPHSGHVLLSTMSSLFHIMMATAVFTPFSYFAVFIFLFVAVWIPCCVSDIAFPLICVNRIGKN